MFLPQSRRQARKFFRTAAISAAVCAAFAAGVAFWPIAVKMGRTAAIGIAAESGEVSWGGDGWLVLGSVSLIAGAFAYIIIRIVGWWVNMRISGQKDDIGVGIGAAGAEQVTTDPEALATVVTREVSVEADGDDWLDEPVPSAARQGDADDEDVTPSPTDDSDASLEKAVPSGDEPLTGSEVAEAQSGEAELAVSKPVTDDSSTESMNEGQSTEAAVCETVDSDAAAPDEIATDPAEAPASPLLASVADSEVPVSASVVAAASAAVAVKAAEFETGSDIGPAPASRLAVSPIQRPVPGPVPGPVQCPVPFVDSKSEGMQFRRLLDGFTSAIEGVDSTRFVSLFTPDAIYDDVFFGEVYGVDAIGALVEDHFFANGEDFRWEMHDDIIRGGMGYAHFTFSYTSTMEKSAGQRAVFTGCAQFRLCPGAHGYLIEHYREWAFAYAGLAQLGTEDEVLGRQATRDSERVRAGAHQSIHRLN